MNLAEKIQKDLVDAMRAKDELRLSVLRGIKAAIKHKEVEKIRALDDAESIQILQTLVKQRKESIEQFTKGNRPELAGKETKELAIIESYLPATACATVSRSSAEPPHYSFGMPLPESIALRFTEEDAGYVTVRPVVKQVFGLAELADMVVGVTGKNVARVQQIFRAGTLVYNG